MITAVPRVAIAVRDMDEAIRRFRDSLGFRVRELDGIVDELGIRIAMGSSSTMSHIELMAAEQPERPLSRSLLRFLDRRGEGLFAMMLYADDPDAEAEEIARRGPTALPLMPEAGGRDFHPRDTAGVLIRIYPTASDARIEGELDTHLGKLEERSSRTGLSGIRAVQIAVSDLEKAVAIYRDGFGLDTELPATDAEARVAFCTPPRGARIELHAASEPDDAIGHFLAERGPGLFAIVHESDDPAASARALAERGVATTRVADDLWEIDPTLTFGASIRFRPTSA